ncbi:MULTISPECIES: nitrile hydratase accessory protein [unclassified Roseofilum]|uniref:nitrile hydratase accessory protein n=1 Tax=unclassified Roseofilum TaxID=2620099 RepID=UPI000E87D61E|nr:MULTISPECIES: nitrile hydratase accessory protein [unclassified Roseofilum]MBP0010590.1 nitrile hydratase accessory protein [Roseofilum sp. Belize Diploria]MBP0035044.1 nitrile hydratase accessory protein [Roseofilum sp. Belize BBD 4]HBR00568.1 nitrile hydratase accessory protein [Cyanobacteria bacterium UBA11691]
MFTKFEHFAATSLMGSPEEAPPRRDGHLYFDRDWERLAFGVAIALSKQGHYEWEDFRQQLISKIGEWEAEHGTDDPSWDYYQRWLAALEEILVESEVLAPGELDARMADILDACSPEQKQSELPR